MWEGIITQELKEACNEYERLHDGMRPELYDDIEYNCLTYDEFLSFILEANKKRCDILDVYK